MQVKNKDDDGITGINILGLALVGLAILFGSKKKSQIYPKPKKQIRLELRLHQMTIILHLLTIIIGPLMTATRPILAILAVVKHQGVATGVEGVCVVIAPIHHVFAQVVINQHPSNITV